MTKSLIHNIAIYYFFLCFDLKFPQLHVRVVLLCEGNAEAPLTIFFIHC